MSRLWSYIAAQGGLVDVSSEPRAGYYVSTQDRPAYVTDLSSDEISAVFDLMHADHARWERRAPNAHAEGAGDQEHSHHDQEHSHHNGNGNGNGNGKT
jgi:hypothetical protein